MGSSYEAGEPYTIRAGDTLWAIARDHGVAIKDLQSWNPIPNPDKIIAGNRLIVRGGTRKTPGARASSSEAGESYIIRTGDTLCAIARDHGVTIEDLQSWNLIPDPDKIIAGNRLIVRGGTRKTPGARASSSEAGESYIIKTGDTLCAIARDHGVTIEDLQSWNPIPDPDKIIAGNRLIVRGGTRKTPGARASSSEAGESYIIKTGDTLRAIARDHGVAIEDLQSWNPIPDPDKIIAGNRLIVRGGTRDLETPGRSSHPEIKRQAFFSHTEQVLPGDESSPSAPHLISVVTNILKGKLATFNDVVNLQKAVGMHLERRIVEEVKSSSVFVAILTPAFSQRFWPMYELHLALKSNIFIVPVLFGTTYGALVQNFKNIDPRVKWRNSRREEKVNEVIESSVANLDTLSERVSIMWKYEKFDKNSIERFGQEVAVKVEEVA